MVKFSDNPEAFGKPGMDPRWTHSNKDGVGTAYSQDSKVWFTLWRGIVTEVYYPTVDMPQLRDLQLLITDGKSFFHEEKRHFKSHVKRISMDSLGYTITNSETSGMYKIHKQIITNPHFPCLLQEIRIEPESIKLDNLQFYVLCAPHMKGGGKENNAYAIEAGGRNILVAEKEGNWMALSASVPFSKTSCGFVGSSDGWTDISQHLRMEYEFGRAERGNVALTGQLDLRGKSEFVLALAFGHTLHSALTTLFLSLGEPFADQRTRFETQWNRAYTKILPLDRTRKSERSLYRTSYSLLLSHEDKSYPGAIIASLTIPWGEANGDDDRGGYHLVWTRDLVNTATALLAAGNTETPLRALIYLAAIQHEDGGFAQNSWITGQHYWGGIQLDEVSFPIMLAWRLHNAKALREFDPYEMVMRGAKYLILNGPATQEERWEEASGYSPSTLASNIAALICAAEFAKARRENATSRYLEEYADFLEEHIEDWTVTSRGTLVPGVKRHYIRICPVNVSNPDPDEDPDNGFITIKNREPGEITTFPAREIVDAGFLELVRYGIRRADDRLIVDSLKVVDSVLRVDTPLGPSWHRYNHDGYGQRDGGGPFLGSGKGRAWPLLTGERAHYELAAGNDAQTLVDAIENFATPNGLIPEQIWDEKDLPEEHLEFGGPTGSAMPLMWAHAEYIKLLRSISDGEVFDRVSNVKERYIENRYARKKFEIWKPNRRARKVKRGSILRVQMPFAFRLHWSPDSWITANDCDSTATGLGLEYADIPIGQGQSGAVRFTFYYPDSKKWEGTNYLVNII
ncbi:MAG TPA: glycoside hydrolase family 15 protein [Nitrososphaerales archaeon]|nr:glycoside hydrolase family 15 protein [Nitrososphaerales archaeon]